MWSQASKAKDRMQCWLILSSGSHQQHGLSTANVFMRGSLEISGVCMETQPSSAQCNNRLQPMLGRESPGKTEFGITKRKLVVNKVQTNSMTWESMKVVSEPPACKGSLI